MDKKQKVVMNPINKKDDKCSQYIVTVTLNNKKIKKDPRRIAQIKPFIDTFTGKK